MATHSWSMAGPPPSTLLSQAALQAVGQEVHSSDKNTMRKNNLEAAPGPCRSHWSCTGPVHLQDGTGTQGPLATGLLSRHPCRVPGTARSPYRMLQCQEIVLRSWLHQEEGRCAAALIRKKKPNKPNNKKTHRKKA